MFVLCCLACVDSIPRPNEQHGSKKRVHEQQPLSDEVHYKETEHNNEYDHQAFLGNEQKKTFDELSPEESKLRLGLVYLS